MSVLIQKVEKKSQLRDFIKFPYKLYNNCENWVPALIGDEFDYFDRRRNGAYEYCDADCFLAYRDGILSGRVAAIINRKANSIWNEKVVRFGWLDFVEDAEVLKALVDTVAEWGKAHGCDTMKGPLGFCDMDKEGLLVEGFEYLSPFTCLYNYPYYDKMLSALGFEKAADWTQKFIDLPDELPPAFKYSDLVEKKFGLHVAKCRNRFEMARLYGMDLFHLLNESFSKLFEFAPLSDKQIKTYLTTYVPIMDKRFICVLLNREEKPVGFVFCVPSLSKAVKKGRGYLFPFGFFHILRALRHNDSLECLMIGILPEYQGMGGVIPMFKFIFENCKSFGIKKLLMNPQLETNINVQGLWDDFPGKTALRRRTYIRCV